MEFENKTQLIEFIRKQSLKLMNENQAFAKLEDTLEDVDAGFVQVNEKRFEKLKGDEEKAMRDEDYVELQKIKQEKVGILSKLIASYKKKTEILEKMYSAIKLELNDLDTKGSGVFKDKTLNEFNNDDFEQGSTVKITTLSSETTLEKISQNNQYKVINTTIPGIEPGDVLTIPNLVVGHSGKVTVYRDVNKSGRFEEIGTSGINTVKAVIKNPSN